jgi:hypothetical protein
MNTEKVFCNDCKHVKRIKIHNSFVTDGRCYHKNSLLIRLTPYYESIEYSDGFKRNANNDCKDFEQYIEPSIKEKIKNWFIKNND